MTALEAADELGMSLSYIYKQMDIGQLAYEKRGKRKFPVDSSVEEFRLRNFFPAQIPLEPAKSKRRKEPYQYEFL